MENILKESLIKVKEELKDFTIKSFRRKGKRNAIIELCNNVNKERQTEYYNASNTNNDKYEYWNSINQAYNKLKEAEYWLNEAINSSDKL